jgi:hypothetical protein
MNSATRCCTGGRIQARCRGGLCAWWTLEYSLSNRRNGTVCRHFNLVTKVFGSRDSSVSIVSDCGLDGRVMQDRSLEKEKRIFPLTYVFRPAVEPTQLPVQWVPRVLSPGVKRGRGVTLTTHPIWCRGREWVGAIPPRCVVGLLYLLLLQTCSVVERYNTGIVGLNPTRGVNMCPLFSVFCL